MIRRFFAITNLGLGLLSAPLMAQERLPPVPAHILQRFTERFAPSAAVIADLAAYGETSRLRRAGEDFLVPDSAMRAMLARTERERQPTLAVEALFVYTLPDGAQEREGFDIFTYNTLRSISSMKGIEYWSASRQRMRIMFHDAYVVDSSGKRLPDPIVRSIPKRESFLVFQHDSSFGVNTYDTVFEHLGDTTLITMRNLTVMHFGILPLVQPDNLVLHLVVIPGDGYLVFYGYIGVRTFSFFGLERNTFRSFYNRIKALYNWFSAEMMRAF